jgi:hypothetical protein
VEVVAGPDRGADEIADVAALALAGTEVEGIGGRGVSAPLSLSVALALIGEALDPVARLLCRGRK